MKSIYTAIAVAALSVATTDVDAQSKLERVSSTKATETKSRTTLLSAGRIQHSERPVALSRGGVANGDCANAESITVIAPEDCATAAVSGDNSGAAIDGEQPGCDDPSEAGFQDVWYMLNSGSNMQLSFNLTPADPSTQDWGIVIYDACGGTEVYCELLPTSEIVLDVTADTDYYVQVYSNLDWGTSGAFTLCVSTYTPPPAPANDECDGATVLSPSATCQNVSSSLAGATQSLDPSDCSGWMADQANDVWFSFVAGEGTHAVIVTAPEEDVVLEVYEGACGSPNSLGCVDAGTTGEQMSFTDLTAGNTYYARVYAYAATLTTPEFEICVILQEVIEDVYCAAGADGTGLGLEERIVNVTFAGIDNDSPNASPLAPSYSSFISQVGSAARGATLPIAVDVNRNAAVTAWEENQVLAWIDFNQDEEFDAATELVFTSEIGPLDIFTGNVTIPMDAVLGETRLRVRLHDTHDGADYENNFNDTPCGLASYGEVEDYTVNITDFMSLNEVNGAAFSVFPNPSNGDLTIVGSDLAGTVQFELIDMTGRVVFSEGRSVSAGQNITLPLAGKVAAGSYNLSLTTEGTRSVRTVVIR